MLFFCLILARELGYTLKDLLESLGEGEIDLWYELHKRQPIINPWYQTGLICSTMVNYPHGAIRWLHPEDFMPRLTIPLSDEQKLKQLDACFMAMVAATAGIDKA
jgi:hypothetical protein